MTTLENISIDLWDFEFQFADLLDFLSFSENNIEFQRRSNLRKLDKEASYKKIDCAEYAAELQNIEGRFDIYLARSIRFAAIISLATTVEWIASFLKDHAYISIPDCPKGSNKSIHILKTLLERVKYQGFHNLENLEKIIKIRNCIAHSMGSVKSYKYGKEIEGFLESLNGFSIADNHFIDGVINIERGAIESIIMETQSWATNFIEECRQKSIICI